MCPFLDRNLRGLSVSTPFFSFCKNGAKDRPWAELQPPGMRTGEQSGQDLGDGGRKMWDAAGGSTVASMVVLKVLPGEIQFYITQT